ncbi:MAG TPA: pitrilysin family protein [Steroidobacteraceae bacterium]|jgi:zinc protease|nr:pitrilysin family protein [Steroidobacteraceae bacterium]
MRVTLISALAICIAGLAAAASHAAAAANPLATQVARETLTNGLRVVVVRDPLAPVVATSVNYLVGSDEAPKGFPGTAHAQEHMMFRGSPGLSADQLADIGSVMGGNFNANTRESVTQYLFTVPAEDLNVALHIEAIRMAGALDSASQWKQERGAIEQEVAQDVSDPGYVLYERMRAAMFAGTPYAHDALGTRPSFQATTAGMLQHFYDTWYAPNNAILVIAGDVDPQSTLLEVKRLFGGIQPKQLPQRPQVRLGAPRAAAFTMSTDQPNGMAMIAVRTPGLHSADFAALEVLSDVLDSRRFALFGLVPQGKALDADFSLDPLPQAGIAYAAVSFAAGQDPKALESAIRSILSDVAEHGVPADLVAAAKLQERRAAEFQKNSIAGFASDWSDALALYKVSSPDAELAQIEKVTVQDVDRVARKYLDLDHAVTAVMLPRGSGKPVPARGGFGGQESISLGAAKPTPLPTWAAVALRRLSVPPSTLHPVVTRLPNGLRLIVQTEDVSNTVSVYGHILAQPGLEEPHGEEGVSDLLDRMFMFGSNGLHRLQFQQALDAIGASEQAGSDFNVQVLPEHFDRGVQLLAQNELDPYLPAKALAVLRDQLAESVAARNVSPGFLTRHSLRQALFPATDPSLRIATPASLRALTPAKVQDYYRKVFRPDLATIVVIGKVTPQQALSVIQKYFGSWKAIGPKPPTDLPQVPQNKPDVVAVPDSSRVQDIVVLAQTLPLTRSNPEYYPLELGNAVLGGSFYSTRLSIALRKQSGLVYSVNSTLEAGRTRGAYLVEYACDPPNVAKAAAIVRREIADMQRAPVGKEELLRVKELLVRQIPLDESSVDAIAGGIISRADLGLPLDEPTIAAQRYIELGPQQIEAAFRKWMRPGDLVRVSEGPAPK